MAAGLMPKRIPKPLFSQYSGPPRTGIQTSHGRLTNPDYDPYTGQDSGLHPSIESGYGVTREAPYEQYPEDMVPTFAGKPTGRTQTAQQLADWNQANKDWAAIDAARKKRQEAYEAMAQKTGSTPKGVDVGQYKEAGDSLPPIQAAGGQAPAYESALFGQPRKRRERYRSIVNLRNP